MARQTAAYVYGNTARELREPLRREEIERRRQVQQRPRALVRQRKQHPQQTQPSSWFPVRTAWK